MVRRDLTADRWKYDRPDDAKGERRSRFPNDAFIGLLFGNSYLVGEMDNGVSVYEERGLVTI